jgi:hypothetical protein
VTQEHHGHLHLDVLEEVDDEEVDVRHRAAHRVALEVLHDDGVNRAVDVQFDDGVETGRAGQRGAQQAALDRDGHGADTVAIHHAGDPPLVSEAVRRSRPGGTADVGDEGVLGHGTTLLQAKR